ncbi:NADH-quinone oxidoreductase subunit N [Flavobacterium sp. J49]|uniref:NADH-quinone oxidoreductase subunit N n=1 Tax=Flavobacterium sp. J49 TaxID=2718534 RepID=UPI0015935BBE|nr:NADH-quinone oxidoreductase subunit N [Flavobacterium sp. J49]MBF6641685.1 NADH-quinone oxidoreductase subunit N [Flavobacterium sp. J49]NIC02932.1 NADH-quinone oxidoreductase subunit N [Flavobacterium sp. J49]
MQVLITIVSLGVFCLLAEIFNLRKLLVPVTVIGLLAILGISLNLWAIDPSIDSNYVSMIAVDKFSNAFSSLFILLTIFLIVLSGDFYKEHQTKISDFIAIKIFLLAGAVAMVSFTNLSMFFLGIEVLSISLYVLAASRRLDLKSNEAGMKYFLLGSFASGIILFGICLIYGATGYFDINEIKDLSSGLGLPIWFPIGITLMIIGMLFKIAAAPFHFWAPDVYEGSPALTTATMSTLAKVVAMATLYKILSGLTSSLTPTFEMVIVVVSILSMTIGNIMALRQDNVKRMLAFSGISHAGFMLMAILSLSTAASTLLYYTAAYALAGIASFAVIIYVTRNKDNEAITNFNGLGKTNPLLAAVLTASLLSMAGIPIFSGFFAKFMLFSDTIKSGYLFLVIIGVINSIISVGYYFKLILAMYTKEATEERQAVPVVYYFVAVVSILLNIIIGLYPSFVTNLLN